MIRLPPNASPPPHPGERTGGARAEADLARDPFRRRDPREGALRGRLGREAGAGSGEAFDRAGDFGRRMRDALNHDQLGRDGPDHGADPGQGEGGDGREDEGREPPPRLLAVAEAVPDARPAFSALFAPTAPVAASAPSAAGSSATDGLATAILDRLDAAELAGLAAARGSATSLRVPLDGLVEGLRDVVVRIEGDRLDVTFTRATDAAALDLGAAAQALAGRLQARFAKRTVRVLEAVEAAGRDAEASPFAVGALFGRAGG